MRVGTRSLSYSLPHLQTVSHHRRRDLGKADKHDDGFQYWAGLTKQVRYHANGLKDGGKRNVCVERMYVDTPQPICPKQKYRII